MGTALLHYIWYLPRARDACSGLAGTGQRPDAQRGSGNGGAYAALPVAVRHRPGFPTGLLDCRAELFRSASAAGGWNKPGNGLRAARRRDALDRVDRDRAEDGLVRTGSFRNSLHVSESSVLAFPDSGSRRGARAALPGIYGQHGDAVLLLARVSSVACDAAHQDGLRGAYFNHSGD